jgi:phytoene dehydrogenase-like protein
VQQKPTINIIGAGISGLSAGCYLQMNGLNRRFFDNSRIIIIKNAL